MQCLIICDTYLVQAASALGLLGPRQSVGVQMEGGAYCVLLPYSVCAPCSAKQVFTTVEDHQSQARALNGLAVGTIGMILSRGHAPASNESSFAFQM